MTDTASNHLDSASGSKVSQMVRSPRDILHASSGSSQASSGTARSRPLQQLRNGPSIATVPVSGRSKPGSQEERKTLSQRGNPASSGGIEPDRSVCRSDSTKASRVKNEPARTAPDHSGTLHSSTENGSSQTPKKENAVDSETTDKQSDLSTAATGGIKAVSSTPILNRTDMPAGRNSRQASASSGVPRLLQRDVASKRVPTTTTNKTGTSQRAAFARQMSDHSIMKRSGSNSSLVSPSVQARSEALPSEPVSLTRYTPRNSRHYPPRDLLHSRRLPEQANGPSNAVFEVANLSCRPSTFYTLTLMKSEIDKANKDMQHKVYSSDFKVSIFFAYFVLSLYLLLTLKTITCWSLPHMHGMQNRIDVEFLPDCPNFVKCTKLLFLLSIQFV